MKTKTTNESILGHLADSEYFTHWANRRHFEHWSIPSGGAAFLPVFVHTDDDAEWTQYGILREVVFHTQTCEECVAFGKLFLGSGDDPRATKGLTVLLDTFPQGIARQIVSRFFLGRNQGAVNGAVGALHRVNGAVMPSADGNFMIARGDRNGWIQGCSFSSDNSSELPAGPYGATVGWYYTPFDEPNGRLNWISSNYRS